MAQADGRIVGVGSCRIGPGWEFSVFRNNVDGSQDLSFGAEGQVVTLISGGEDHANCVTLQGDGKIIVGGEAGGQFALVRYYP